MGIVRWLYDDKIAGHTSESVSLLFKVESNFPAECGMISKRKLFRAIDRLSETEEWMVHLMKLV